VRYTYPEIRSRIAPVAEKYGIPAVYLFGSYARDEATDDSDIDILVSRKGSSVRSAFDMGALYMDLRTTLGAEIDLLTLESLDEDETLRERVRFFDTVDKEKVLIYERR
jgi:predicted nucleotidyltransferase